jgi:hypothetical protein
MKKTQLINILEDIQRAQKSDNRDDRIRAEERLHLIIENLKIDDVEPCALCGKTA